MRQSPTKLNFKETHFTNSIAEYTHKQQPFFLKNGKT